MYAGCQKHSGCPFYLCTHSLSTALCTPPLSCTLQAWPPHFLSARTHTLLLSAAPQNQKSPLSNSMLCWGFHASGLLEPASCLPFHMLYFLSYLLKKFSSRARSHGTTSTWHTCPLKHCPAYSHSVALLPYNPVMDLFPLHGSADHGTSFSRCTHRSLHLEGCSHSALVQNNLRHFYCALLGHSQILM